MKKLFLYLYCIICPFILELAYYLRDVCTNDRGGYPWWGPPFIVLVCVVIPAWAAIEILFMAIRRLRKKLNTGLAGTLKIPEIPAYQVLSNPVQIHSLPVPELTTQYVAEHPGIIATAHKPRYIYENPGIEIDVPSNRLNFNPPKGKSGYWLGWHGADKYGYMRSPEALRAYVTLMTNKDLLQRTYNLSDEEFADRVKYTLAVMGHESAYGHGTFGGLYDPLQNFEFRENGKTDFSYEDKNNSISKLVDKHLGRERSVGYGNVKIKQNLKPAGSDYYPEYYSLGFDLYKGDYDNDPAASALLTFATNQRKLQELQNLAAQSSGSRPLTPQELYTLGGSAYSDKIDGVRRNFENKSFEEALSIYMNGKDGKPKWDIMQGLELRKNGGKLINRKS